ncbi:MAG: hypothetical protein CVU05_11530 [Bacteroidetes bacterium HGW-Bacteroidetes-21]|jgi:outer membrane protein assembly factor BamD (BamD/ComL family)|nr:MAG: hypothetical protein CVU05_11530 [Bacteroidetes bacterium HGW-Bacteroidetes-21]
MKKITLYFLIFLVISMISCSEKNNSAGKEKLLQSINNMEKELFSDPNVSVTADVANKAVLLYSQFVNENPNDSLAAGFLFKSAEMFRAVNNGNNAIKYYQRIIDEYPASPKVPVSIFLMAFVYENTLMDMRKAKEFYQLYLTKYPDGEFAKDAAVLIENLGKSPEELIKSFEDSANTDKTV